MPEGQAVLYADMKISGNYSRTRKTNERSPSSMREAGTAVLDPMKSSAPAQRRLVLQYFVFGILTGYLVVLCIYFSNRRMMWADEFNAWSLLTDPSWDHMIRSWGRGADGGSLFYYTIGRLILSVTGYHVLVMRLFSAFCLWGAAVLWWRLLQRRFASFPALAAVLLIWFCDFNFVYQLAEVRFYGLLVFSVTIAVSALVWIEDRQPSYKVTVLTCFLANGLLVLSHYLGLIYSAILAAAVVFSQLPIRRRLAAIGGMLGSWLFFLIYITPIRSGGQNFNWIQMPTIPNTLRFYFHMPTTERFFNAAFVIFIAASFVFCFRRSPALLSKQRSRPMLLLISVFFLLVPLGCYLLSHIYHPLFVSRYLMPYSLGFGFMFACALWLIYQQDALKNHRGYRVALQTGLLCIIGFLHVSCLKVEMLRPLSDIQPLMALDHSLPLVISDYTIFYEMRYYGGSSGTHVFYPIPSMKSGYLAVVAQQGYAPGVVGEAEFLGQHKQFLYLDFPTAPGFNLQALVTDPKWVSQDVGMVQVQGTPLRLFRVEHR